MSYQLINRSAHDTGLADESVHCVVTSPPYFALRKYAGEQGIEWPTVEYSPMPGLPPIHIQGCEPGCEHEWGAELPSKKYDPRTPEQLQSTSTLGKNGIKNTAVNSSYSAPDRKIATQGAYCIHCGGWRGGLGLEPTIEAYIGHLILVMREMWRVLRDDGTAWVNLGDSYAGSGGAHTYDHANPGVSNSAHRNGFGGYVADKGRGQHKTGTGLKPKNLMGIPQRFMLAAQAEGWIIRSALPWIKRNGMPESVTDRPAQVVESIFLLAKSERYFWDGEAVREPHRWQDPEHLATNAQARQQKKLVEKQAWRTQDEYKEAIAGDRDKGRNTTDHKSERTYSMSESGRNFRSSDLFFKTWQGLLIGDDGGPLAMVVNPVGFSGAHFACFPLLIPEIAIRASTSAHGVCPTCGAPWTRVVTKEYPPMRDVQSRTPDGQTAQGLFSGKRFDDPIVTNTTGWEPTCQCGRDDVCPATVLDPFSGSGTTGKAALMLGRNYIGVDISQEYLENLAPDRLSNIQMELAL